MERIHVSIEDGEWIESMSQSRLDRHHLLVQGSRIRGLGRRESYIAFARCRVYAFRNALQASLPLKQKNARGCLSLIRNT